MATRETVLKARSLRRRMTPPEARLWTRLRRDQLDGISFRRQHPIGPFVLEFYCPEAKLTVEVDGSIHHQPEQAAKDQRRTRWLATQGVRVMRIAAEDVRVNLDEVLVFIAQIVRDRSGG